MAQTSAAVADYLLMIEPAALTASSFAESRERLGDWWGVGCF